MKKTRDYQRTLIKRLKNPLEAAEYLKAALEQGDQEMFLVALRNVGVTRGGLSRLSRKTRLYDNRLAQYLVKPSSAVPFRKIMDK